MGVGGHVAETGGGGLLEAVEQSWAWVVSPGAVLSFASPSLVTNSRSPLGPPPLQAGGSRACPRPADSWPGRALQPGFLATLSQLILSGSQKPLQKQQ